VKLDNIAIISAYSNQVCLEFIRFLQKKVFCYFDNYYKINTFVVGCTLTVSAYEQRQNISKTNCPQQGVWRQAGRCLVGHFAGIWKFSSRPSLCETPPDAKPQTRYLSFWGMRSAIGKRKEN